MVVQEGGSAADGRILRDADPATRGDSKGRCAIGQCRRHADEWKANLPGMTSKIRGVVWDGIAKVVIQSLGVGKCLNPDQIGFTAGRIWSHSHVSYSCEESNEQGTATAKLEMQS